MEFTRSLVEAKADEYERGEPLYPVERDRVGSLPDAFASGEFGRRDAEWVVRWYYRRSLGAYPDEERRAMEEQFRENDFEAVKRTVVTAANAEDAAERLSLLTDLDGVDVPVASAFLFFFDPDAHVALGRAEWDVLSEAGLLDGPYPDPPSVRDYETYLDACRSLTDRLDCDGWTLYRALRRLRNGRDDDRVT